MNSDTKLGEGMQCCSQWALHGRFFGTAVVSGSSALHAAATGRVFRKPPPPAPRGGPRPSIYCAPPPSALVAACALPEAVAGSRLLRCAIVGEPNAGKSTLLNAILGMPLSAVSRKCNTTVDRVLGVRTEGSTQIAFTDTPGFVLPGGEGGPGGARYQRTLVAVARSQVSCSDVVLLVVDIARRMSPEMVLAMEEIVALSGISGVPVLVAANKSDLVRGVPLSAEQREVYAGRAPPRRGGSASRGAQQAPDLLALKLLLLEEWLESACKRSGFLGEEGFSGEQVWVLPPGAPLGSPRVPQPSPFTSTTPAGLVKPVRPIAAAAFASGAGVEELIQGLAALAPARPWDYAGGTVTVRAPIEILADAIRGRLFESLHAEVPYRVSQRTRSWREVPLEGSWAEVSEGRGGGAGGTALLVHQDILVPSGRVAGMLLARGGAPIKAIATSAAADVGKVLGKKVFLQLHVTVKEPSKAG